MESETKKLSDEVAELFAEFVRYYEEGNLDYKEEIAKGWGKYFSLSVTISLLIAISFVLLGAFFPVEYLTANPHLVTYVYVYIIFGFMVLLFCFWLDFKSMEGFLKDAPLDFLKAYPETGKKEIEFLERLSGYSVQAITYVKLRYEQGYNDTGQVVGLLVGTLTKIGIFPALFALLLAAYKVSDESKLYTYAAFSIVGIYFMAFKVSNAGIRFKRYSFLLSFYLEHMRETSQEADK